jgi:hypothetical protein
MKRAMAPMTSKSPIPPNMARMIELDDVFFSVRAGLASEMLFSDVAS